ncbi:putative quinol monooxygenase [Providencia rettgeri]
MAPSDVISVIAVLKAKQGKIDALKQALQDLLLPTRREWGNMEYIVFQLRDSPDMFYVRESWRGQDALDEHMTLPHFQSFISLMDELLAEPLRLDYLKQIEPY